MPGPEEENIDFLTPNGIPENPAGDDKAEEDFSTLSVEDTLAVKQLQEFSVASRILGYCLRATKIRPDFNIPLSEWDLSMLVQLSCVLTGFGTSNLSSLKIGLPDPSHADLARQFPLNLLIASFKIPKEPACSAFTQISLIPEVAKLCGAEYVSDEHGTWLVAAAFNIAIKLGYEDAMPGVVLDGGEDACRKLSVNRGVKIEYVKLSSEVHFLSSLILARRSIKLLDGKLTFLDLGKKWASDLLGPPMDVELAIGRVLANWCDKLTEKAITFTAPPGMSLSSAEYISCLGQKCWDGMSQRLHDGFVKFIADYRSRTTKLSLLQNLFSNDAIEVPPSLLEWMDTTKTSTGTVTSIKYPAGNGNRLLSTYKAVNDYGEECRKIRSKKDYTRKSDGAGYSGGGQSAVSVPVKFGYAWSRMRDENVLFQDISAIDAFGVAEKNHWEQFVNGAADVLDAKVVFKDINPRSKITRPDASFEVADITALSPNSGVGKVLFDDTFVVSETPASVTNRKQRGGPPEGGHACHRKLTAILDAGYTGGIVKVTLGSEQVAPVSVGAIPGIFTSFKAKYSYVKFFPGGSSHSQEYLLAFGQVKDGMRKHIRHTLDEFTADGAYMTHDDWLTYARYWLVIRAVDFVRANRYNTIRCLAGVMGGRFNPVMRAAAVGREYKLRVPLNGSEVVKGTSLNALVVPRSSDPNDVVLTDFDGL